ncbi:hypothetical protein Prudu_007590 [Prunus dulcis]|uniref:Uncharacterized protein n=1 Tax=Prunus dulcis TaxID=3755 RepID=A0A4Y1R2A3_PRUDU|nr:hypothetical protein Prudu_007590 [Prunus dulcis]
MHPSNKYRSVDGYPGRCFMNYTSHKSSELSSADGDRERGNSAENNGFAISYPTLSGDFLSKG